MARLKQMRSYIAEAVAASFRKLKEQGRTFTAGRVARVVQGALRETFEVFDPGFLQTVDVKLHARAGS